MHGVIHGFNLLFFSLTDKVLSGALLFKFQLNDLVDGIHATNLYYLIQ